jgi:hypothetical protein
MSLALSQDMLKLFSTDLDVDRHGHRPRGDEREANYDPFSLIRRKQEYPGARLQTRVDQTPRQSLDQIGEFSEGIALRPFLFKSDQGRVPSSIGKRGDELLESPE